MTSAAQLGWVRDLLLSAQLSRALIGAGDKLVVRQRELLRLLLIRLDALILKLNPSIIFDPLDFIARVAGDSCDSAEKRG